MNVYNFLEKLNSIFPSQESKDALLFRINEYAKLLNNEEEKTGKQLDYEKMLSLVIKNYPYRSFPNYTEISKCLVYFYTETNESNTKWEYKNYIVTTKDNREYEFVSVPPSWEGVHSASEFRCCREI